MVMVSIPENRKLPKREADLFKSILKLYERKDYKKGLKAAEAILKKFPTHGETLAMKGLTLNALGKKEEAHDHVRRGLREDLRSHVCWHVYGLLHRSERNYAEAIKSYLNALKHEPENLQILKDLAALQIQIREVKGFVETRRKLLGLKSNLQQNWTAYAVANHVAGNAETTVQAIDAFVKTLKGDRHQRADERYPHSELLLYKNLALSDAGMTKEALDHLEACKDKVMDKLGWTKKKGELLLALGRHEEAEEIYRELLGRGEENYVFHRGLQCAVLKLPANQCEEAFKLTACALPSAALRASGRLSEAHKAVLKELYRGLRERFEGSPAAARIPLTFLEGEELRESLDAYMRRHLRKGVPSLGSDLSSVFEAPAAPAPAPAGEDEDEAENENGKGAPLGRPSPVVTDAFDLRNHPVQQMVMELTKSFVESLRSTQRFPVDEGETEGEKEPEQTLAWALFLRSQLEERTGFLQEACDTLDECSALQPSMLDFIQRKGRVLKKMGAVTRAAEAVDAARLLDKADRYMNSKATKYLLRAGQIPKAEQTIAIFTRHEGDPQHNLFEMQCSWFELEWAEAQIRAGKPGLAMKKAMAVHTHFEDFVEDQFDFHTYCMRKVTLRSYLGMLRMVDELRSQKSYRRASALLVRAYLKLHDERPSGGRGGAGGLPDMTNMTAAEKKRAKNKARKDAKKKAAEQELEKKKMLDEAARQTALAKETANGESKTDDGEKKGGHNKRRGRSAAPPVDTDPLGLTLLEKDPLPEAARLVALLSAHAGAYVETHLLAFDVAMKRGKYMLAARAVIRGRALEPTNPELLLRTIQLYHMAQAPPPPPSGQPADAVPAAAGTPAPPTPVVARVLAEEAEGLLGAGGLDGAVAGLLRLAGDAETGSLGARVCAAKALALVTAPAEQEQRREQAVKLVREGLHGRGVTVSACAAAVEAVRGIAAGETGAGAGAGAGGAAEELRRSCAKVFPLAEAFGASSAGEGGAAAAPSG